MAESSGLWRLFLATGLPEAYLAIRARDRKKSQPAFRGEAQGKRML